MEDLTLESRGGILKSILLILFLAAIGAGVIFGFRIWNNIKKIEARSISIRAHLSDAAKRFVPENFSVAKTELEAAKADIDEIVRLLESSSLLQYVPFWSARYQNYYSFSKVTQQFIDSGVELTGIVEHISEPVRSQDGTITITGVSEKNKREILERTVKSIPVLQGIRATLVLTRDRLAQISNDRLDESLLPIKSDLLSKGEYVIYTLDQVLPLLEVIPPFIGYREQKDYLMLLQDPTELRPSGGLVEMYSVLQVKDATILSLTSKKSQGDSRASGSGRPSEIGGYTSVNLPSGFLQDINWGSDFPQTASKAIALYGSIEGRAPDGVIAVTPEFFVSLLRMTGEIRIGDTIWSSDNFLQELHTQLQGGSPAIGRLARAIIEKVNEMPFQQIYDVTKLVQTRLNEKHILLMFRDQKLQEFARRNNWTGHLRESGVDFFMISDANVGSKKTDPFIERRMTRQLIQDELDNFYVSLDITYRNNATITSATDRYRDRIQIFVPKGSELLQATGFRSNDVSRDEGTMVISEYKGFTVFEGFTVVEPFQNQKIHIEYRLPKGVVKKVMQSGDYSLLVQQQPGSHYDLTASFFLKNPVKSFSDGGFFTSRAQRSGVQFQTDLRVDREFYIQL